MYLVMYMYPISNVYPVYLVANTSYIYMISVVKKKTYNQSFALYKMYSNSSPPSSV
jgi:hypothetical protein